MTGKTWRIVFLDHGTIGPGVEFPAPDLDHEWINHERTAPELVIPRLADADIAVTNKVVINAAILAQLPQLKLVALAATGANVVDIAACQARGVGVCNVRNYAVNAVPEHVLAMLLALRRQLPWYRSQLLEGAWQEADQFCFFNQPVYDLASATLGIVGTGSIATALGRRAQCLGMKVIYHSVSGRTVDSLDLVDWPSLLASSHVVSLHCPLTPQTEQLLDGAAIAQMRRGAIVINTARGPLLDLAAVAGALDNGQLGGAGLDVFDAEPPPADGLAMRLARRDNVIVTPHVAWASVEAMQALANQVVTNITDFAAGRHSNRLD